MTSFVRYLSHFFCNCLCDHTTFAHCIVDSVLTLILLFNIHSKYFHVCGLFIKFLLHCFVECVLYIAFLLPIFFRMLSETVPVKFKSNNGVLKQYMYSCHVHINCTPVMLDCLVHADIVYAY